MSSEGILTFKCQNCGCTVGRSSTDPQEDCPQCGKRCCTINIEFEEQLQLFDEFAITATNQKGGIVAERSEKADGVTSARLSADDGTPSKISVQRSQRVRGFADEGSAVESLVKAFNVLKGTQYAVEEKTKEDSDFADRILVSEHDKPATINVQVRNLDTEIIAGLGKHGAFDGDRTTDDLITHIDDAIADKANIDRALKERTILLLAIPAAIGQKAKQELQEHGFEIKGFWEVWVSPFHEDCFRLNQA
jgi:hypothetical protein